MERGDTWNIVEQANTSVQAGRIESVTFNGAPSDSGPPAGADEWVRLAFDSTAWQHVSSGRDSSRQQVCAVVAKLVELREEAENRLRDDPWQDPGLVRRFTERIEWLLGEPAAASLELYPAEAALFVLTPFLYRVHCLRLAARFADVEPAAFGRGSGAERRSFETFAEGHDLLVARAQRSREQDVEAPIGWWLFHRWLAQRAEFADPEHVRELLDLVGASTAEWSEVLAPKRVSRLLHGLRRGPDVCNPEYLELLPADERVGRHQRIRYRRLALLTCLAYSASAEMTSLPSIIAEHLGVSHPVDLSQLRRTLEHAYWGGSPNIPALRADCHHEAVIEGLREYTGWVNELLHAVRRTAEERITSPMPRLPSRLSADGVTPADGAFTGWASFRLDERRTRDLLMGLQLYKERDLAVRELYQNALDACRYRRARTQYLDRTEPATHSYEGRITFEQGADENGREYLECHDNGIGMGESEIRGVFSNAGARFAEQPDFVLEQANWDLLDPPVRLFPNSRFGIGVMSYFMLADEIRVTTCRMGLNGRPGPSLEVSIFGPGHLFRVVERAERGAEPGTRVRLYLREDADRPADWSSVDALERLLGIAEFPTAARHGKRHDEWATGELKPRKQPGGEEFGIEVHGTRIPWSEAPEGVQVVWCEAGGALLVDGLFVEPAVQRGVLSDGFDTSCAVVNLTGEFAPARLSVDRTQVLEDVSGTVGALLERAARDLVTAGAQLPTFEWICEVARHNVRLGDVLSAAASARGARLEHPPLTFDTARTGCFPTDVGLLAPNTPSDELWMISPDKVPDHVLLWRLLAHRNEESLAALAEMCPEIDDVGEVLPAVPSQQFMLLYSTFGSEAELFNMRHVFWISKRLDITLREAAFRLAELGVCEFPPKDFPDLTVRNEMAHDHDRGSSGAPVDLTTALRVAEAAKEDVLLRRGLGGSTDPALWPSEPVSTGHIAQASLKLGIPVPEVCSRLAEYGLKVDRGGLPDAPRERTTVLLSRDQDGQWPWLSRSERVPPGHLLAVARELSLEPAEVLEEFVSLGFAVPDLPKETTAEDLRLLKANGRRGFLRHPGPVPYSHLFQTAESMGRPLEDVLARLRAYGFDVPLCLPEHSTPLDRALLQPTDLWIGVETGNVMPFAHIVLAAQSIQATPRDITERLAAYGVETSRPDLPEGLSLEYARELLSGYNYGDDVLVRGYAVSLKYLIDASQRTRTPIPQVAEQLRTLGLNVTDVAETVRAALARVPRARTSS